MSNNDFGQSRGHTRTAFGTDSRTDLEYQQATIQKLGTTRAANDVIGSIYVQAVASDAVDSYSTGVITAATHSAIVGDLVIFTSGNLNRQVFPVYAVATNTITLSGTPTSDPSAADTFDILRFSHPRVNSSGALAVTVSSGSITADTELPAAAALTDNFANPTAPAIGSFGMLWDGATWDRAKGDSTDGALVNLGSNNDVTVTGSVTANAGTNLNTSLLALESGGNLASAATSLAVIDDWDESDRAKVNPIVGVAGVAAGAGAVGTTTQRVTLASDDPAVTSVQIIDDWDESDRCKINPIVGQAGVQGGSGLVSATTQRVVLATDVALPAGTNGIGKLTSNDGVDIGDVTINNASGGSAVNIQDGGNSITIDYATTGSGTATGAIRVELPTNGTGVVGLNAGSNAIGKLAANSGVDIGDVDVTSIVPGSGATNLGKAEDAQHSDGDIGVMALGVRQASTTAAAVTWSGATSDYSPFSVTPQGHQMMVGPFANGEATIGNPVPIGGYGVGTTKALVDDADVTSAAFDITGRIIVAPWANPENYISGQLVSDVTDTTATEVIASQASKRTYIGTWTVTNNDATVATRVDLLDGATVKWSVFVPAVTGNVTTTFDPPLRGTSATAWKIQCGTTSAQVRSGLSGFTWNN